MDTIPPIPPARPLPAVKRIEPDERRKPPKDSGNDERPDPEPEAPPHIDEYA